MYSYFESYLSTNIQTSLQYNVFFVNIAVYIKLEKHVKSNSRAFRSKFKQIKKDKDVQYCTEQPLIKVGVSGWNMFPLQSVGKDLDNMEHAQQVKMRKT